LNSLYTPLSLCSLFITLTLLKVLQNVLNITKLLFLLSINMRIIYHKCMLNLKRVTISTPFSCDYYFHFSVDPVTLDYYFSHPMSFPCVLFFFFLKYSLFGFYKSNGISDSKTQTPPIYNSKLETFSFKQFAIVALKLLSPIPNIRKISHGWIFEVFFSSQNHHNVRSHSLELSLLGSFFSFMNHVSCSGCIKWRKDIVEKKIGPMRTP